MATSPALLLLSYREHGDLGWLRPYLDDELDLPPLDEASLQRLAASLLGPGAGLETLARRIAGLAAGNPYFVEEAVQALVGQGDLQGLPGTYALVRPVQTLPIPDSVHALLAGRIDRLPETQKALTRGQRLVELLKQKEREPLSVNTSWLRPALGEKLGRVDFSRRDLIEVFEHEGGLAIGRAELEIGAGVARPADAKLLQIAPGAPVLEVQRIVYSESGEPVHVETAVYRADTFRYRLALQR